MSIILLFGASGDIHKKKVYPGLYELYISREISQEINTNIDRLDPEGALTKRIHISAPSTPLETRKRALES